jgi:hypothetical protein
LSWANELYVEAWMQKGQCGGEQVTDKSMFEQQRKKKSPDKHDNMRPRRYLTMNNITSFLASQDEPGPAQLNTKV